MVVVERFLWYRWALERLGLEYEHQKFRMRSRVERFFRYLKERTAVSHTKLNARDHLQGITNPIHSILPGHKGWRWLRMLIWTLSQRLRISFYYLIHLKTI
ncbi:MAG: hypothetical protein QXW86_13330 [Saccharolobus sp.]|uniref:hypothetical protein n=1 Tax=Saccharolobus sp. TaxID=2100761 RepID=UPI0031708CB3